MLISSVALSNDAKNVQLNNVSELQIESLRRGHNYLVGQANCVNNTFFSSQAHRDTNCLEDFIKNYDHINPPTFEEYCNKKLNGVEREVDYEAEYAKYLETRECKNDTELQALNKTQHYTASKLKERARLTISSSLKKLQEQGLLKTNVGEATNYIVENSSVVDLANYSSNMRNRSSACHPEIHFFNCLNELVSTLPEDPTGKVKLSEIIAAIDEMIEKLEEKVEKIKKETYENDQKRVFSIEDFASAQDGDNVINLTAFNEYSK